MGRGGSGGGHSSGGSHSHSSGSHGSSHSHSSRGGGRGSSGNFGGSGSFGGGGNLFSGGGGYHRPSYGGYNCGYGGYRHYGGGFSASSAIITIVILLAIVVYGWIGKSSGISASTTQRTKVESGNAYIADCVQDEIGWIKNPSKVSAGLKKFYEKTGCQPYIILKAYDPSFGSEEARETWSKDYYDTNFKENQNVVLYTYFCDEYDEGNGNDTLFVGTQSGVVFDAEAQGIFWDVLDYDWNSWDTDDNDGMFVDVFNQTAKRIMTVTTTTKDIIKTVCIFAGLIGIGIVVIVMMVKKRKHDRERAAETERILNTRVDTIGDSDDLVDRYQ